MTSPNVQIAGSQEINFDDIYHVVAAPWSRKEENQLCRRLQMPFKEALVYYVGGAGVLDPSKLTDEDAWLRAVKEPADETAKEVDITLKPGWIQGGCENSWELHDKMNRGEIKRHEFNRLRAVNIKAIAEAYRKPDPFKGF